MPILLRGLAWLATALTGLLPAAVDFFARWVTKKTLMMAAYYSAYAALTAGVFASVASGISVIAPDLPTGYHQAAGMFLPGNAYLCISAIVTATVVRWVYDYQVKLLDISTRTWANM